MMRSIRTPRMPFDASPARGMRAVADRAQTLRNAWRRDPVLCVWLTLWFPFWVGSDAPPPILPGSRHERRSNPPTAAGTVIADQLDRMRRGYRISWFIGSLFRGVTLGITAVAAWGIVAAGGLTVLPSWWLAACILLVGALLGGIHGWFLQPDRLMAARMLDQTFCLDERMVSALDREPDTSYVSRLQLADAANTLHDLRLEIPKSSYVPVREGALCIVALGVLATTLLANIPRPPIDPVGNSPIPGFVPASERLATQDRQLPLASQPQSPQSDRSLAELQEQAQQARSARDELSILGQALQGNSLTQPAADSIAGGEYSRAADQLRGASLAIGSMSEGERGSLASELESAADQLDDTNPELAQAARDAADALRDGSPDTEQAIRDLADRIEETGQQANRSGSQFPDLDESQSGTAQESSRGQEGDQAGSGGQQQGAGQDTAPGAATDPGQGADAAPGVVNSDDPTSANSQDGGSEEGSASDQGGDRSRTDGSEAESRPGESGGGDTGSASGESGSQMGQSGSPDEETDAAQGGGAGTGQTGANDQTETDGQGPDDPSAQGADPNAEVPEGEAIGDPPSSRNDRGEANDGAGSASHGSSSLELSGSSDENIPANTNSGASSLGSGGGSSTSSGNLAAGNVGLAGPDSNRVPDNLRDVVQNFFGGPLP